MKKLMYAIVITVALASCGGGKSEQMKIEAAKQAVVDSVNNINTVKQRAIDSVNAVHAARAEKDAQVARNSSSPSVSSGEAPAPKKKGWSSAAKGAVIGAGAGAITGAMVDKKKGEGAIVGGLLGAGAGAATGAIIDGSKKKKNTNN
ncbi:MAG: glycine zipper 2TM domain-containing protein [Filimonas sp.]|nr:glycine zipper 2TM domain-containing protein [Filimonas sp.]